MFSRKIKYGLFKGHALGQGSKEHLPGLYKVERDMAASTQRYPGWPISPQHAHMHPGFFAPASPCLVACASWQQQHHGGWVNQLFPMQSHPQPTFGTPAMMQIMQPQRQHLKTVAPSPRGPQSSSKQRCSLSALTPESTARKDPGPLPTVARPKSPLTTRSSLSFSVTKIPAGIMHHL